jgi:hypothetical protein
MLTGRLAAQISPGPLARPHSALEGSLKCTQCHGTRKEMLPGQCLACHKEIAWLKQQQRGLHAGPATAACASCHPDHAGSDFALVSWTQDSLGAFNHSRALWPLEGAHATVDCAKCHRQEFRVGQAAKLLPGPRTGPGWLGLERQCSTCHRDVHSGALGQDCTTCHGMEKWKPAPKFDHAKTDYPLTGAHLDVACAKCHQDPRFATKRDSAGAVVPVFKPLPHTQCSACHNDPHANRFGPTCSECHQTRSFTVIEGQSFNHSRTRYPLQGKHAAVACKACHEPGGVKVKDPVFTSCGSCHKDAHAGLATLAGKPADCAACHTVQGFTTASFTVAQHAKSKYPLEGKHQAVDCGSCHVRQTGAAARSLGTSGVVMRPAASRCTSGHQQDHGTQLVGRPDGGECSSCHTVAGWTPSSYGVSQHAQLRLALTGRHAAIACGACHSASRKGLPTLTTTSYLGKAQVALALGNVGCADCHVDAHRGRLATQTTGGPLAACTSCHDAGHFRPSTIDVTLHAKLGFQLDGAHGAVPCIACHATLGDARPTVTLVGLRHDNGAGWTFPTKGKSCASCHAGPHGDQFAGRQDKGACEGCHGTDGFAPASRFDHGRDAAFPLTGGHARVACGRCHVSEPAGAGKTRVRYHGVSTKCESCHSGKVPTSGGS